jgi:hypothetical protein
MAGLLAAVFNLSGVTNELPRAPGVELLVPTATERDARLSSGGGWARFGMFVHWGVYFGLSSACGSQLNVASEASKRCIVAHRLRFRSMFEIRK